jgi:hypothetical protein
MLVKRSYRFPHTGRCQSGVDRLELFAEVFLLEALRRIHLLRQFAIPMAPFEVGAAVSQRVPAGLVASPVRHGDGLSDHVEVWESIDIVIAPGGRWLGVEE